MEEHKKGESDSLKKGPLAKLHERIQNKYMEMQRKLDKSRSVDSIASLNDEYSFKNNKLFTNSASSKNRWSASSDFAELNDIEKGEGEIKEEKLNVDIERYFEKHDIVIELVKESVAIEEVLEDDTSVFEAQFECDNDYLSPLPFFDSDFKVSTDS